MTLIKDIRGNFLIKFTKQEEEALLKGVKLTRPVGYSAGWFRLAIKLTKVRDPYK